MGISNPIGEKFGKLTVLGFSGKVYAPNGNRYVNVRCDCGVEKEVTYAEISGPKGSRSCGCSQWIRSHGMTDTKVYKVWCSMKSRCLNPNDSAYANYGGRGITISESWVNSFEQFYLDMGDKPEGDYLLDREDNSLGYSKSNCRWVSRVESNQNTRANVLVDFEGETICIAELARRVNVTLRVLYDRYYPGIAIEELTRPINPRKPRVVMQVLYQRELRGLQEVLRLSGSTVTEQTLRRRLQSGIPLEQALLAREYIIVK